MRKPKEPYVNIFAHVGKEQSICRIYIIEQGVMGRVHYRKLYDEAWLIVRAKRHYAPLTDELLWHKVFETYIGLLPKVEPPACRDCLIEHHLRIVGDIAGQIAWKRCPKSFGIWSNEAAPHLSHVGLVYELTAVGIMAMFIAADRYSGKGAFSTYANFWIRKFVRLYLEDIISVVPRTGDMGIEEQGVGEDGPWVVYKPRRSVMDLLFDALAGKRNHRGKAAGGMAMFDGSITIPGPNPGDKEIEVVGTESQTNPERLDYLQRHVSYRLYPWIDIGSGFTPRLELKGHPGGRASDAPPAPDLVYELADPEFHEVRPEQFKVLVRAPASFDRAMMPPGAAMGVTPAGGLKVIANGASMQMGVWPWDTPYSYRGQGSYNSWEFGGVAKVNPKTQPRKSTPHWRNSLVFAVDYLRRHGRKLWRKPTYEEAPLLLAAE